MTEMRNARRRNLAVLMRPKRNPESIKWRGMSEAIPFARASITMRPRVVIVGAGFGGLWAAKTLARGPAEVVVIDRQNYRVCTASRRSRNAW